MVSDQPTRYETGLVMMYFGDCPRANPAVNQVSIHLAIRVHGRDRTVVGDEGWVTLFEEKAEVGQLEITTVRTIQSDLVGQRHKHVPKIGDTCIRFNQQRQSGSQGFIKSIWKTIRTQGCVGHLRAQDHDFSQGKQTRGHIRWGRLNTILSSYLSKHRKLRDRSLRRYLKGGVQHSKMVLRDMEHVFQVSGGWGIRRATETLHRNRGSTASLVSFFIRGQVKPIRGV